MKVIKMQSSANSPHHIASFCGFGRETIAEATEAVLYEGARIMWNRVSQPHPNILDLIASNTVDMVINTPTKGHKNDSDGFKIRRSAVEHSVACVTAIDTARAVLTVQEKSRSEDLRPVDITTI